MVMLMIKAENVCEEWALVEGGLNRLPYSSRKRSKI